MIFRLLAGALLALAVLYPTPDPDALVAQGATRLLERDREASDSLFRALDDLAERKRFALAPDFDPRAERGFRTWLNVHNAERRARGLQVLELASSDETSTTLALHLVEADATLQLSAQLRDGGQTLRSVTRGPLRLPNPGALVPPLLAIGFALAMRRVILALFAGVWAGAALLRAADGSHALSALSFGLWDVPARFLVKELTDSFRIEVIGFVLALLAIVGIATRAGGIQGLVERVLRFARSARSTLGVAYAMGLSLFFDDYANCLVVGNAMRPVTDRMRISREKLAYIVDSTAAPVAGLSLLSTWIAFEVSTYAAQLPGAGIHDSAYAVFLWSLPYRFYSIFALAFVALVIWTRRDFGPMLAAERRAHGTGHLVRPGGRPLVSESVAQIEPSPALVPRARNALIPIGLVIVLTFEEIFRAGGGFAVLSADPSKLATLEGWTQLLFEGGGAGPLFRAASVALAVAACLVGSRALRLSVAVGAVAAFFAADLLAPYLEARVPEGLERYAAGGVSFGIAAIVTAFATSGVPTARAHLPWSEIRGAALSSTGALGFAIAILFLAWMIGAVCVEIGTADYLVALTSGRVAPGLIPILLFFVACVVAFSTGTSWGTMSILLPNVVAMAAAAGEQHALGSVGMVTICIGAVLEGAIFGDHCSPISDTTVLSSIASGSDHIDHVRTQLPYALVVASLALLVGYVPSIALETWPFPIAFACGIAGSLAILYALGRRARG